MKINVFDINHIVNQIKCASPPGDKDMHKLINNLSILLEKNVNRKQSPLESTALSTIEKLNETFVDLCFLRKEIVQRFSREYFDSLSLAIKQIKENRKKVEEKNLVENDKIDWNLKTMSQPTEIMKTTFSKLHKARSIIEDALDKNVGNKNDPELIIDSYFN